MSLPGAGAVPTLSEIGRTLAEDLARLDEEAAEIELLVQQIRAETERHEARRLKGEERVTSRPKADGRQARRSCRTAPGHGRQPG